MTLPPPRQLKSFLEIACELHLLNNCVLILTSHIDYLEPAVHCLSQSQLLVAIAVCWHVCSLDQCVDLQLAEINQLDGSERLREVERVDNWMVVWHRDQVCAQVIAPEGLTEDRRCRCRVVSIEDE